MMAAEELARDVGVNQACDALGVPRATFYRQQEGESTPGRA